MAMNNNQDPSLCANGCGFFGQPATRNLCSKCYRDFLKHQTQSIPEPHVTSLTSNLDHVVNSNNSNNNSDHVVDNNNNNPDEKNTGRGNNRCGKCKKRVGLLGFMCQCDGYYCRSHRYPEEHCCGVDMKARGRADLEKTLFSAAECKADKLPFRLK